MSTATKPKQTVRRERKVLEYANSKQGHRVDRENGVIYGVKVLGLKSVNGNTYRMESVAKRVGLYDRIGVFLNHPRRSNPDEDRSVEARFGQLESPRMESDGIYADLHYVKSHPSANQIAELAERFPSQFGLSHNARVIESVSERGVVFEDITRVISVDVVANPATTKGIFESRAMENDALSNDMAPVEAPAGDPTKQAFLDGVGKIWDGDGDPADKAKRISSLAKELLKVQGAVDEAVSGKPSEPMSEAKPEDAPATESKKPEPVSADKRYERALSVLESAGITTPNVTQIRLVAALESEADQKALAATWKPAAPSAPTAKPQSKPAMESANPSAPAAKKLETNEQIAAALFGG